MTLPLDEIEIFSKEPKGGVQNVFNFSLFGKRYTPPQMSSIFDEILRKGNVEEWQSENYDEVTFTSKIFVFLFLFFSGNGFKVKNHAFFRCFGCSATLIFCFILTYFHKFFCRCVCYRIKLASARYYRFQSMTEG